MLLATWSWVRNGIDDRIHKDKEVCHPTSTSVMAAGNFRFHSHSFYFSRLTDTYSVGTASLDLSDGHSGLARGQLLSGSVPGLGGMRIVACGLRPQPPDGPHDQTPPPYDCRSGVDPLRRTCTSFLDWNAVVRATCLPSRVAAIAPAPICMDGDKTCTVLGPFCDDSSCLAPTGPVYARHAVRELACGRTNTVSRSRTLVLVACYPALAKRLNWAAMVHAFVPFSGDSAVRHPFRISCLL
jgi:hypothetical protein